jgi:putative tryptophan/tyrosine transport system substrate-binding protein
MLLAGSATDPANSAFLEGMRNLGYVDGVNTVFERRFADGKIERLPALATQLVASKPHVIFAPVTPAALAARGATKEIPIVFAIAADPVGSGLAATLSRPGYNATGLTSLNVELIGKRMQLLKELSPRIARVAIVFNPNNSPDRLQLAELERAAAPLGITVIRVAVRNAEDYDAAFSMAGAKQADALMVIPNPLNIRFRARILDHAAKLRIPTMDAQESASQEGALISYSISWPDNFRRAAAYVDKILKGAKPGDLPIEQPTKLELVINLKTARALGIDIPRSVLLRADQVIE